MLCDMKKFCCLDLKCCAMFFFYNFLLGFCWFNKVFSSNMFEFINDTLQWPSQELRYDCQTKHVWGEIPSHLDTIPYYLLYCSTNYDCCFDNKNSRFFKGQTISKYKICNALCWYQRLNTYLIIWIFYYFRLENLLLGIC